LREEERLKEAELESVNHHKGEDFDEKSMYNKS